MSSLLALWVGHAPDPSACLVGIVGGPLAQVPGGKVWRRAAPCAAQAGLGPHTRFP